MDIDTDTDTDTGTSSPHAHPTSRRQSDPPSQQRRQARNTTPSPQHEARLNPNQRRLQLRNSAFGTQLSPQRLGARFSRIFHGNEDPASAPAHDRQESTTPHHASLRSLRSNYSPNASLGILTQISNSTHIPSLRKRASIPIYEDNPQIPLLGTSPATPDSQYHDASSITQSPLSPLGLTYIQHDGSAMRLREVSGNERRRSPSLSSPLASANKQNRRRTTGMRHSSLETAEYIDYMEKQLEQVKQAMHSPRSGKPVQEKMKLLKAENTRLQKTIEELESSFEARVKSSVEHMTAGEGELRRKVRSLEEDLRERDMRIEELEYEHDQARLDQGTLDTLKATIERLEGDKQTLQDANSSIERRNEVLTEMLAFSPTKAHGGFELVSPLRNRGRLPRPVSMMGPLTRFPSSPTLKHTRPSSMVNSPAAISSGGYFSPRNVFQLELEHPCNDADSGLGESCSTKSPITSSSRRSTLISQTSTSPSAWGFPLPVSPSEAGGTIRPIQKRKPRRFMTGSRQLKTLLLPSMAADSAGLTSPRSPNRDEFFEEPASLEQTVFSHDLEGTLSSPKREVSRESIDPATCFLSNPFEDVNLEEDGSATAEPGSSPPHLSALVDFSFSSVDSVNLAVELDETAFPQEELFGDIEDETGVEETVSLIESREGKTLFSPDQSQQYPVFPETLPTTDVRSSLAAQDRLMSSIEALMCTLPPKHGTSSSSANPYKRRRTSSMSQTEAANLAPQSINLWSSLARGAAASLSTLRPPDSEAGQLSQQANVLMSEHRPEINPVSVAIRAASRRTASPAMSPKRLSCCITPLDILQRRNTSSSPLAAVTIRSIYGTLSRYTTYIRDFKRDPLALARRVIANAWRSNWKRFGKLSWWVLGIFFTGARRDYAEISGWDWDHYDGEAVADKVCRPQTPSDEYDRAVDFMPRSSPGKHSMRFDARHDSCHTRGSEAPAKPALKRRKELQAGLGQSLYLWGKFSVAILLAVGGAVWKGPGEMLKDCDGHIQANSSPRKSPGPPHDDYDNRPRDGASHQAEGSPVLPKRYGNIFPHGASFDSNKIPSSPSSLFTFGSPISQDFCDDSDDDPDNELEHYYPPGCGEDEGGFHPQHSVFS